MTDDTTEPILATVVAEPDDRTAEAQRKVYDVPRRFGLGTIFVVTTAFALLFGILGGLGVPVVWVLILTGFLAVIGFAQMLLFGGKRPRLASVVTGIAITCVPVLIGMAVELISYYLYDGNVIFHMSYMMGIWMGIFWGSLLGYAGGLVVASVFLVMDYVERWLYGRRASDAPTDTRPISGVR